MLEIKFSGRGGQGVVLAANLLGLSFFKAGMYPQGYSVYGGERRGAPVVGFLRVDKKKILHKCEIRKPGTLIYIDDSLFDADEARSLIKPGGTILINSAKTVEQLGDLRGFRVGQLDAVAISDSVGLGKMTNTILLGAYCRLTGQPGLDHLLEAMVEMVPAKTQVNQQAAKLAFDAVKITEAA